jgi:hypothetical protein
MQPEQMLELIEKHGSTNIRESLLKDLLSKPKLLGLGEINHASPSQFRRTVAEFIPDARSAGFQHVALELRKDFNIGLSEFYATGDVRELAKHVCSLRQGLSMYCQNRFIVGDEIGTDKDIRSLTPDYAEVVESIFFAHLKVTAIDVTVTNPAADRDIFMAEELNSLMNGNPPSANFIWLGGARHLDQMNTAAMCNLLSKSYSTFTIAGLDCGIESPAPYISDCDLSFLRNLSKLLTHPTYLNTSTVPAIAETTLYTGAKGKTFSLNSWNAAIFYPSLER